MLKNKHAIILCSGGLDSITTAYFVKKRLEYSDCLILFFDYGQRSLKQERDCSKKCAKDLNAKFLEIKLEELNRISNSLINKKGEIKKLTKKDLRDTLQESQKYYVPCRNILFLNYALASAEAEYAKDKKIQDIFVGFKCEGKESYPDATKKFVKEMNKLSKIACSYPFKIKAPLINMDKEDIILLGKKLGVKLEKTFSCYAPVNKKQCGFCLACQLRKAGFYWAGIKDETNYYEK